MSEITQCFIASEPVSMNVFNRFTQLIKENDELTRTMETLIECLSEFDHNKNIQDIGHICKKKLEEIKRGKG